ncbi:MAG: sulfite exporter TauE/SafE family protein [Actinomycetota bacterium]|nr:sulfite exporter TauE/SafE family protein [Actinomycetota bacterium]
MATVGIFLIIGAAAFLQSLSGFGFSLLAVPLLALIVASKSAVVGSAGLGAIISLAVVARDREHVAWRTAGTFFGAALAGMPVGLLIIERVPERALQAIIAVAVLGFSALLWRDVQLRTHSLAMELGVGVSSGILSTSTGMSGPPLVMALHAKRVPPQSFRATLAAVFACGSISSLLLFALAGQFDAQAERVLFAGAPALLLGIALGEWRFRRIRPERFRTLVLVLLIASGIVSLVGALAG